MYSFLSDPARNPNTNISQAVQTGQINRAAIEGQRIQNEQADDILALRQAQEARLQEQHKAEQDAAARKLQMDAYGAGVNIEAGALGTWYAKKEAGATDEEADAAANEYRNKQGESLRGVFGDGFADEFISSGFDFDTAKGMTTDPVKYWEENNPEAVAKRELDREKTEAEIENLKANAARNRAAAQGGPRPTTPPMPTAPQKSETDYVEGQIGYVFDNNEYVNEWGISSEDKKAMKNWVAFRAREIMADAKANGETRMFPDAVAIAMKEAETYIHPPEKDTWGDDDVKFLPGIPYKAGTQGAARQSGWTVEEKP